MSLIISGGGNLQSKAGDSAALGYAVPPLGEACVAQRARCQAEGHQQRSPGFAPKQAWPWAHHCFPSPTLYSYSTRLCLEELLLWTTESHTSWKHPDLAIRTQTHTEQPVLPRNEASSQQRISFGHADFKCNSPSWHLLWNKVTRCGPRSPRWVTEPRSRSPTITWMVQRFCGRFLSEELQAEIFHWQERREFLQGSGAKLPFIIISRWLLLQSCAVRVKLQPAEIFSSSCP